MTDATDLDTAALQQAAEETWISEFLAGPTRTRLTELPPQTEDSAPDMELPDSTGTARRLSEFWSDGPVHLVFLRQFGCGCLADRWEQLEPAQERIAEAGATLVAVCQAEPARAAVVAERRGYAFPLLCDAELVAYQAYGLPEGVPATITQDFPGNPVIHRPRSPGQRRGVVRSAPWSTTCGSCRASSSSLRVEASSSPTGRSTARTSP